MSIYTSVPIADHDIRVLEVHPGHGQHPLQCSLRRRGKDEPFEALSWVWGQEENSVPVTINNYTWMIRPHLAEALCYLRDEHEKQVLWVDAICINQLDNQERERQVAMMQSIYSNAAIVRVYLGPQEHPVAFQLIDRIRGLERSQETSAKIAGSVHESEWRALAALMQSDWFSRRWVVQEIALARKATLSCGKLTIPWEGFTLAVATFRLASRMERRSSFSNDVYDSLVTMPACKLLDLLNNRSRKLDQRIKTKRSISLEWLVSGLTAFQVTRHHDVVYAVLGLAEDARGVRRPQHERQGSSSIDSTSAETVNDRLSEGSYIIDYDQSPLEAWIYFVNFAIERSRSLDILCRPWAVKSEGSTEVNHNQVPSWIVSSDKTSFGPDRCRRYADSLVSLPDSYHRLSSYRRRYNASMGKLPKHRFASRPQDGIHQKSLWVEGFMLDMIGFLGEEAADGVIPPSWMDIRLSGWLDPQTQCPPEEFWRTMVVDRHTGGWPCPLWYSQTCQEFFNERVIPGRGRPIQKSAPSSLSMLSDFTTRAYESTFARRLMTTSAGRDLGLVPREAQLGDFICVLFGCSVPVVLRKRDSGPSQPRGNECSYELIGECFVYGKMDGEAMALYNNGQRTLFDFELR